MRMCKSMGSFLAAVTMLFALAGGAVAQTKPGTKTAAQGKHATATPAPAYDKALLNPAALTAKAPETFEVKFTTTKGDFTVKVTRAWAPLGADRFYSLVRHHFYDGASLFRVVPGFIVQFGISAYPEVSKALGNATIKDDPVKETNRKGTITYAMGGLNSRTTQVFINYADNKQLDHYPGTSFAPFGEVTEGMDVVEKFFAGYGDFTRSAGAPQPDKLEQQGKAYLEKNFPNLDTIKSAVITSPAPAEPPAKTTAKSPAKKSS